MRKQTLIALLVLVATLTASGQTQQPVKTNEQIAVEAPISMFIPDAAVVAKLTAEEQAALKLHLTNLMLASMKMGYQDGAKATSKFLLEEFAAKYATEEPKPSKLEKLEAVLRGIAASAPTNPPGVNCVSRKIGNTVYTDCK
jgi:hypothetical protein